MFESFLRQYIRDLISCSIDNYDIKDNEIEEIASELTNDDNLWNIMDDYVYGYIDKYREDQKDVVGFDKEKELEKLYE